MKAMFQRADVRESLHLVFVECSCPACAAPSSCKHVGVMCCDVEEFCQTGVFKGITSYTSQLKRSMLSCHAKGLIVVRLLGI